jgi:large subunit ribosomal protein L29
MKPQEFRNMTKDELVYKIASLKEEMSGLLFRLKTGTIENSSRMSQIRRDIARIKTILKEDSYAK